MRLFPSTNQIQPRLNIVNAGLKEVSLLLMRLLPSTNQIQPRLNIVNAGIKKVSSLLMPACRNDVLPSTLTMLTCVDTSRQTAGVRLLPSPIIIDIRL